MRQAALICLLLGACPAFGQSDSTWGPARWVWDDGEGARMPQTNAPRYLRSTFLLDKGVAEAELWITADNAYSVHVNGTMVGKGNDWKKVDRYDVVKKLLPGKNVLAIEAANQGGVAGVIARLRIRMADGKVRFVVTDRNARLSLVKGVGWQQPDFDDRAWAAAAELGGPGIGPWSLDSSGGSQGANSGFNFAAVDPASRPTCGSGLPGHPVGVCGSGPAGRGFDRHRRGLLRESFHKESGPCVAG